jgi:hypothetical protein
VGALQRGVVLGVGLLVAIGGGALAETGPNAGAGVGEQRVEQRGQRLAQGQRRGQGQARRDVGGLGRGARLETRQEGLAGDGVGLHLGRERAGLGGQGLGREGGGVSEQGHGGGKPCYVFDATGGRPFALPRFLLPARARGGGAVFFSHKFFC